MAISLLSALLWTTAPAFATAPAETRGETEALGLQAAIVYAGTGDDAWMPVTVELSPRRPVVADIEVTSNDAGGRRLQTRGIELRAGATAVYRFVVPASGAQVIVRESDGAETTAELARPDPSTDDTLVGALGLSGQQPPLQDLVAGTDRTAGWTPVDPEWVTVGPEALAPLSGLVADAQALAGLDAAARRNLSTAVAAGLDLVVVATSAGPVGLDGIADDMAVTVDGSDDPAGTRTVAVDGAAWSVSAADVTVGGDPDTAVAATWAHGRGRMSVTAVAPGEGRIGGSSRLWSLLTLGRPVPYGAGEGFEFEGQTGGGPARLARALDDGSGQPPTIPWLAAFLIAYIVVVGPVNGMVLRRRGRRDLAWVTVPAVTVVFTVAAMVGVGQASPLLERRATMQWWLDGAGEQVELIGVRSPTQTTRDVTLPGSEWSVRTFAGGPDGARVTQAADTAVSLSVQSLAFGGVIARRPLATAPHLEVEAVARGNEIVVDVRNTGARPLARVEVRSGISTRPVGRLAAGATARVTLATGDLPSVAPYTTNERITAGTTGADQVMAPDPGLVWAVATTPEADDDVARVSTTIAVGERPRRTREAQLEGLLVDRELVSLGDGYRPGPFVVEEGRAVLRFRLPPEVADGEVVDRLGRGALQVWDWRAGEWVGRDQAFSDGVADARRLLSPTGELFVRRARNGGVFEFSARTVEGRRS